MIGDIVSRITAAISRADNEFGYSITLVRLVDGVSTYALKMPDRDEELFSDYNDASECVAAARDRKRAEAILVEFSAISTEIGSAFKAGFDAGCSWAMDGKPGSNRGAKEAALFAFKSK